VASTGQYIPLVIGLTSLAITLWKIGKTFREQLIVKGEARTASSSLAANTLDAKKDNTPVPDGDTSQSKTPNEEPSNTHFPLPIAHLRAIRTN